MSLAISTNPDDFETGNESRMDEGLLVKFFTRERPDTDATVTEGRPMFKDVEYIEIRVPGKRDAQACRPATLTDKRRFPKHYQMFKDRVSAPEIGTPLTQWAGVSRSQCEELSFMNVKTVEQLAGMADTNISGFHGGYSLKQKAVQWLEDAGEHKLKAENDELKSRMETMEATLAQLSGGLDKAPEKAIESVVEIAATEGDTTTEPAANARRSRAKNKD